MKEYTAEEKCRAVLSIWLGRKKAAEVSREIGLGQTVLWQWQDRALSGMLEALEPRGVRETSEGPALPETLRRLLDRKVRSRELSAVGSRPLSRPRSQPRPVPESAPGPAAS